MRNFGRNRPTERLALHENCICGDQSVQVAIPLATLDALGRQQQARQDRLSSAIAEPPILKSTVGRDLTIAARLMSKFALRPALSGNYPRAGTDLDDARSRRQPLGGRPKRMMDVVLASLGLVLLAPIMLMVAGLVRLVMGGPAIVAQKRVGFGGRTFVGYKFRTMPVDGEAVLRRHLAIDF